MAGGRPAGPGGRPAGPARGADFWAPERGGLFLDPQKWPFLVLYIYFGGPGAGGAKFGGSAGAY